LNPIVRPWDELCFLGVKNSPLHFPLGANTLCMLLICKNVGRTEDLHPRGQLTSGDQLHLWGSKFAPGCENRSIVVVKSEVLSIICRRRSASVAENSRWVHF
jgi:hypothetical protein